MPRSLTPDALTADLDRHLARVTRRRARRGLPAPQVRIEAPGFLYRSGEQTPFFSASIAKTATATLIAQEVERGSIAFDTPIAEILGSETDGLFRSPGATIEHLLSHTSGAACYYEDDTLHGPRMKKLITEEPERWWEAADLLQFVRERQRPIGEPGERFRYSDTGFVLLGRALEVITGRGAYQLMRERIIEPAGMTNAVMWLREPGPARIAPVLLGRRDFSATNALTIDWMGGGFASTTDDLAAFARALTDGTLLSADAWEHLATPRNRFRAGIHYGLGVMQLRFDGFSPLLRGLPRPVGHLGSTSAHMFADRATGSSVVLNFHSSSEMRASFMTHIRIAQQLARLG